jgi:leader peptidase (prepilin peptidase)/N-methyltransferase
MYILTTVFVFIFGLLIGSFLNVCIYRMPKGKSIVFPASHCPACEKNIAWYDNIPVVSFIVLGGKCRFCKTKISFRYPIVEMVTAILLAALFLKFGVTAKFLAYSVMSCGLVVATFVDFEIQEIPDEISIGGAVVGLALAFAFPSILGEAARMKALLNSVIGAVAGGGSIYLLGVAGKVMFKKEAMGGGDVKLMAFVGSIIGLKLVLLTFFIAPFLGVIPGIISKIRSGAETIPYGPFLSLAVIIAIFFGNQILSMFFGGII